jgi:hypothetical protein
MNEAAAAPSMVSGGEFQRFMKHAKHEKPATAPLAPTP